MKRLNRYLIVAALLVGFVLPLGPGTASAGALSNYLENKLIDFLIRDQAFVPADSVWVGLATTSGSDAACGTEVTGGGYERVEITSALAAWAGTQSSGSTSASSGTNGTTSNNAEIEFPAPTDDWGQVVEFCVFNDESGGDLLWRAALTTPKTINDGDAAPSFAAGAMTLQIDD